jgi:hypothetical protein
MATPATTTTPREPSQIVTHWLKEITAAKKREQDFRKDGLRILQIYEGDPAQPTPFNILFSNTETLLPALYSATPRPLVERRFKDADPLGKAAALAGQRVLEFLVDTNVDGYETFDEGARMATLDALLPGRAFTTVKYDADTGVLPGGPLAEAPTALAASSPEPAGTPYTASELVCVQTRSWNRVYIGYARKWSKVPWVAYEEQIDEEEATRLFGQAVASQLVYTEEERADAEERVERDEEDKGEQKTCKIYQIWDKDGGKKIRYINEQYHAGYLKEEDDPLQLTGFFNCPKPLQFIEKSNSLTPTAMYLLYEEQAKEINSITRRIRRIVRAIKAKGLYDSALGEDIKKLVEADDNEFVPAETPSSLAAEKGLGNAIWFMPIEALINTLNQLYVARESCKQVIYEITGIADILRGASKASETLGAQKIKEAWGTLRIKNKQKEVQRYARDLLRMMLEIAATKFSEETWAKMTGLPYLTRTQVQQMTAIAQAGDPQAPQTLQRTPTWEAVLTMLRDDLQRAYRIDIETNSTIEPEAAEDQKQIAELMGALGQFLNGVGPLVQKGVLPFQAAQSMLLAITRRFRFGSEIEDSIKQMQPPKPEDDGKAGEAAKQQAQMAQQQVQMQAKVAQLETQLKTVEAEKQLNEKAANLELRELKVKTAEDMLKLEQQVAQEKLALRDTSFQAKRGADDKVRSIKEAGAKREVQMAKDTDSKLASAVEALQATVQQLAQMQGELLQHVLSQSAETESRLNDVIAAIKAPRQRKPIRGKDGRIERVEDTVA